MKKILLFAVAALIACGCEKKIESTSTNRKTTTEHELCKYDKPVSDFEYYVSSRKVYITDKSKGTIIYYSWGDGERTEINTYPYITTAYYGYTIRHTYQEPGTYMVVCLAMNAKEESVSKFEWVTVKK